MRLGIFAFLFWCSGLIVTACFSSAIRPPDPRRMILSTVVAVQPVGVAMTIRHNMRPHLHVQDENTVS